MPAFVRKHGTLVLLITYITSSIYLLSLDIRNPDRTLIVERVVMAAFAPLQSACTAVCEFIGDTFHTYVDFVNTNRLNAELKRKVSRLEAEKAKLMEAAIQNERLRRIVKLDESRRFESLVCSVIGVDPSKLFSSVFIDRGSSDGLTRNTPIITYDGVVGKTVKVSSHVARVQLLTDARSSIAVLVQRSRAPGILQGTGTNLCEMIYIDAAADIRAGDTLLTSGFGGVFPRGLRVGRVRSVVKKKGALTKSAKVSPLVNVHQLEEVLALVAERKSELEKIERQQW
ncbi:MAG: rod shape-determining protein MreC [Candidatus Coatesbacteria bacterium]|nr:MAG: rod shape-determining protein MreC [Candidatus Coatesbacteria bacterium]